MKFLLAPTILISIFLSACTVTPVAVQDPDAAWKERQPELASIQQWKLSGRMSINNGVEHWTVNMQWLQTDDQYQIDLHGPFGSGHVQLSGNEKGVVIRDDENNSYSSDRADILLYETTGINMPIEGIRYWIVGLPSPQAADSKLDTQGRLAFLLDNHWQVNFRRYVAVNGMSLPNKIFIEDPAKEIDVRLIVDNWQLGAF